MFRYTAALILISMFSIDATAEKSSDQKKAEWCDSHREFVTTLEFMRKQDYYEMGEKHSRDVAMKVSKGCTGAAKRYVKVYELLRKVEAGARTSINTAIDMALSTDKRVSTFMATFRNAYSENKLDLDISNSLRIARGLSIEFKGDSDKAKRDYDRLVSFCVDQKKVGGSIPVCAKIAYEVTKSAENYKESASEGFIQVYEFLKNHKNLNFQISKAIIEAKKVVAIHPKAAENYVASFKYAISKKGLNIPANKTLKFAYEMAQNTLPVLNTDKVEPSNRLPANQKE